MTERAVLLRIESTKVWKNNKRHYLVTPIGEVMDDEFRTVVLRLPIDVRNRLLHELQRIALLNELEFPAEFDSMGRGVAHVIALIAELFEHSDDEALIRRW